jgi:hypothetical protein
MSEHLSQAQLAGYSGRTLYPDELLAVDSHLASCDECHERLSRILPGVEKLAVGPSFESGEEPFHLDYDQHLQPYVDGTANELDREIVDSHVAQCSKCANELSDLFAFKEQPVGAAVHTSKPRKQWLPHWRLLPNPALAAAVVIAVFVLTMAVIRWTKYPTSRPVENVESKPSPAPTEQTTQTTPSNPEVAKQPREEPVIVLNDAGGQVTVNQQGRVDGLHELPPDLRESVEKALATRQLRTSPALTGWTTGAANLRSELEQQSTFAPLNPTDLVVETDRPTFRWRALEGGRDYVVTVFDDKLRQVATSGQVTGTEWTTPTSLERGVIYSWQVTALKDGEKVISPKPPLPEARFRILDQSAVAELAKLKKSAGSSHLVMGVFYWKHGLIEKSVREFRALAQANPSSAAVKELLASIRSSHEKAHKAQNSN